MRARADFKIFYSLYCTDVKKSCILALLPSKGKIIGFCTYIVHHKFVYVECIQLLLYFFKDCCYTCTQLNSSISKHKNVFRYYYERNVCHF